MKRLGISLSLWEVFTLFEQLNMNARTKMYFEPQRYHHIMFANFYEFINNRPYTRGSLKPPQVRERRNRSPSPDAVNKSGPGDRSHVYNLKEHGYNNFAADKSFDSNPLDAANDEDEAKGYWHRNDLSDSEDPRKPYEQVKHIFEIQVNELKNVPLLNKFICQLEN